MSAKNARNAFNKMSAGPTLYLDTKGRRIKMTGRGALFTENSNGLRNYHPVAAFVKPVSVTGTRMNINNKNVKTVPKYIRPKSKFLDLNNSNSNSNSNNNNNRTMVHCRACNKTYDGNAQCCPNLNHERVRDPKSKTKK